MIEWLKIAGPLLLVATGLILLAGVAKSAVDIMSHQEDNNIFIKWGPWFDIRSSWKRKYKDYDGGDHVTPAFVGSKGPLVALTDFWHFADFLYLKFYLLGAGLGGVGIYQAGGNFWLLGLAGITWSAVVMGFSFELCYKRIFRINRAAGD